MTTERFTPANARLTPRGLRTGGPGGYPLRGGAPSFAARNPPPTPESELLQLDGAAAGPTPTSARIGGSVSIRWIVLSAAPLLPAWVGIYAWIIGGYPAASLNGTLAGHALVLGGGSFVSAVILFAGAARVGWRAEERAAATAREWAWAAAALAVLVIASLLVLHGARVAASPRPPPFLDWGFRMLPHQICEGLMFGGMGFGLRRAFRIHDHRRARARLESDLSERRFEVARTGIRLDTLIAWLGAINEQIGRDPMAADHSLVCFAGVLRLSLEHSVAPDATLGAEIEFARARLELEQALGHPVTFRFDVPPEANALPCPPHLITTLADAVLYAVPRAPVQLAIRARRSGAEVVITLADDAPVPLRERRLHARWSHVAQLERRLAGPLAMRDLPAGGVEVTVTVPDDRPAARERRP